MGCLLSYAVTGGGNVDECDRWSWLLDALQYSFTYLLTYLLTLCAAPVSIEPQTHVKVAVQKVFSEPALGLPRKFYTGPTLTVQGPNTYVRVTPACQAVPSG